MSDLIDREALLRQIGIDSEDEPGYYGDTWKFIDTIKKMPSAHGTNLAEVGTDCISRQDALEAFGLSEKTRKYGGDHSGYDTMMMYEIQDTIEDLPPIQPAEPKRGRWILDRSGAYCCSKCMEPCATYVMMKPRDKFCKMCGSRNEVTE